MRLACDPRPTPMVLRVTRTKQTARRMANAYRRRQRPRGLLRIFVGPLSTLLPESPITGFCSDYPSTCKYTPACPAGAVFLLVRKAKNPPERQRSGFGKQEEYFSSSCLRP